MKNENLIPAIKVSDIEKISAIRYLPGLPLVYRFNAKEGKFKVGEDVDLGKEISIIPIAHRTFFSPQLFGRTDAKWIELYFLNSKGAICQIMFHGTSADNLEQHYSQGIYYEGYELWQMVLTIKTTKKEIEKDKSDGSREKITYYTAEFSSAPADEAYFEMLNDLGLPGIYRADCIGGGQIEVSSFNMAIPEFSKPDEVKEIGDGDHAA